MNDQTEESIMPKPKLVKRSQIKTQLNTLTQWQQIYSLLPADDPLRDQVRYANDAAIGITNATTYKDEKGNEISPFNDDDEIKYINDDGKVFTGSSADFVNGAIDEHIPSLVNVNGKNLQNQLTKDIKLLENIEKKYADKPGHELLMTITGIVKNKYTAAQKGIGYGKSPALRLYGENGIEKMTDCLLDLEPEECGKHFTQNKFKDPAKVEKSAKGIGILDVVKDYASMLDHSKEWAEEWHKETPDPAKLRETARKLKQDMDNADKHIKNFEQKYFDDLKKPENERDIYNITNHDNVEGHELIVDEKNDNKRIRAINGAHWEQHKANFEHELSMELAAADLKYIKQTVKAAESDKKLVDLVSEMIDGCTANMYMDSKEEKNGKRQRDMAFTYEVYVEKLRQLDEEAAKSNSEFAEKVMKAVTNTPEMLKKLSDEENKAFEEKVNDTELEMSADRNKVSQYQEQLMNMSTEGMDDKDVFDERIADFGGQLAKIIAAQVAERQIKTMIAAQEDMAEAGAGEKLTKEEIDENINTYLNDDYLEEVAKDIQQRDDFRAMMKGITNIDKLNDIRSKATNGFELLEVLQQSVKTVEANEARKDQMQHQKELEIQNPVKNNVLGMN